jgi:hypothetical protein
MGEVWALKDASQIPADATMNVSRRRTPAHANWPPGCECRVRVPGCWRGRPPAGRVRSVGGDLLLDVTGIDADDVEAFLRGLGAVSPPSMTSCHSYARPGARYSGRSARPARRHKDAAPGAGVNASAVPADLA